MITPFPPERLFPRQPDDPIERQKDREVLRCRHRQPPKLSYAESHRDATERLARGEKQIRCRYCQHWIWENLWT